MCEHLTSLEAAIMKAGIRETYRGQPWGQNCREWVYFDCVLDVGRIREQMDLPDCVIIHENTDPKSGIELGFYCATCHDAIMGRHPNHSPEKMEFPLSNAQKISSAFDSIPDATAMRHP